MAKDDNDDNQHMDGLTIPLSSLIIEEPKGDKKGDKGVSEEKLRSILSERTKKMNDSDGVMEILPDTRIAMEILTAQTLSPKDLSNVPFRLTVDKSVFEDTTDAPLLGELEGHFRTIYDLESKLPEMINEALFTKGAWATLILPPDEIDDIINGGMDNTLSLESRHLESGSGRSLKAETADFKNIDKLGISEITTSITDLKKPYLRRTIAAAKGQDLAMESLGYSHAMANSKDERFFKRSTLGLKKPRQPEEYRANPIPIKIPADAIFPIHEPSDPKDHIYYLIPIDEEGTIVSKASDSDYVGDLENKIKQAMSEMNPTQNKGSDGYSGYQIVKGAVSGESNKADSDPKEFIDIYRRAVEKPIIDALKENNIVDNSIDLKGDDSFYRIMLSRALKKKKTRVLLLPADYVCYIAFDYNALGQGVSLLEKTKFWSSLRSILKIADMMSAVTNSVPGTQYEVTFDEADEDPAGTIEMLMHELSRLTTTSFPIGSTNPSDILTNIQKSATRLKINGGEKYANTNVERTDTQRQRTRMDSDLDESTKRMHFTGLGVPVEAVDRMLEGETATGLILSDLMAAKRAMERQGILRRHVEHLVRLYIMLSPSLYSKIKKSVGSDEKAESYIWSLRLSLPSADSSQIEQISNIYDTVSRFIDDAVEAYCTDDMLRGIVGNTDIIRDALDDFRNIIAAQLKRNYIRDNNLFSPLETIVTDEVETGLSGQIGDYYKAFFENYGEVAKQILKNAKTADKKIMEADNDDGGSDNDSDDNFGDGGFGGFGTSGASTPFGDDGSNPFGGFEDDTESEPEPEPASEPEPEDDNEGDTP